ncbi:hypothetical protein M8J75_016003 [Diaphorina citri]|nr:hypothetical protein M8J75_016003 [Diaphorina citri]
MSSGMPELGSKISLISKADIRYEGELFTVDPNECTIALSNVRSFGTEDREAQCPVPAQSQIYDFILFRGSDIKDIRVVQGQPMPPNDPAIVQHQISHPPPSAAPGYPGVVQPTHTHAYSHHLGAAPGSHLMAGSMGASHHVHPSVSAGGYNPMSDLIGSLSRSSTPAPRKSPTLGDMGGIGQAIGGQRLGMGQRAVQRPQSRQSRSRERLNNHQAANMGSTGAGSGGGGAIGGSHSQQPTLTYRDRNDFYDRNEMRHEFRDYRDRDTHHHHRGGGRDNYRDNYRLSHQGGGGVGGRDGGPRGGGGWHNNRQRSISGGRRPRPRSRGPGFGGAGGGGYGGKGGKHTLKFDADYDFDKANSEFNEMLSKLNETKLEDGGAPVVVNGTGGSVGNGGVGAPGSDPDGKKDDSGNETGVGDTEPEDDKFYDKTKSFFDNISCEAVERSKGAFQRTDWRQERKMNSETFGVAATRRGGGYRGRGGFYYGGGRGYNHHRNHYNNQGRNNRGGFGPRGGNQYQRQQNPGGKENSAAPSVGVKTAAQVVASNPAPVAAEAK